MSRSGRLRRLGLNALAVLLGVVLLEGLLQVGALLLRTTGRDLERRFRGDAVRALCIGDSNTYGLYLERNEAYPAQLEAIWNARTGSPRIEVLNVGFPGTNSSQALRRLDRYVETFRPDLMIVIVGANDFWTDPDLEPGAEDAEPAGPFRRALRGLRLPRLYAAITRAFESPRVDVLVDPWNTREEGRGILRYGDAEFPVGFTRRATPDARRRLVANLGALSERTRALGVDLVLMTYPARRSFYAYANEKIREVARRRGEPLVDLEAAFRSRCASEVCPELLFPDDHPNAAGHRVLAEIVASRLSPVLRTRSPRPAQSR